ncbi:dienelactone hydrolase family protein [Thermodesulfobacteriota bacterium]
MKKNMIVSIVLTALCVLALNAQTQAGLIAEKVEYRHENTVLQGYLAYDDGVAGPRPGVLVVHEWWGLNEHAKRKAEQLAEAGYVALALDMYGEGKKTQHPKQAGEWAGFVRKNQKIGRERFMAGYTLLRNHKLTLENNIAAIGYCFGGNVVLSMALHGMPLRGVVSFHGSLPLAQAEPNSVKAKILVCHGADDPTIKPDQIATFQENLRKAGADWQFIFYGGAKHSFTNPEADKHGIPVLGYNRNADMRSWQAMIAFFNEIFKN